MNNQFNNKIYNISITQNICYIVTSIKVVPIFLKQRVMIMMAITAAGLTLLKSRAPSFEVCPLLPVEAGEGVQIAMPLLCRQVAIPLLSVGRLPYHCSVGRLPFLCSVGRLSCPCSVGKLPCPCSEGRSPYFYSVAATSRFSRMVQEDCPN